MVISTRERYIAIGVGAVLAILIVDQIVVEPYIRHRESLRTQQKNALLDLQKISDIKLRRKNLMVEWDKMVKAGMKTDPAEAHTQLDRSIRDWALQAGVVPDQYKRQDLAADKGFQKSKAHFVGNGSMNSVTKFLWNIETTILPIRVDDVTISSTKEGTDSLKVEMDVTVMVPVPDTRVPRPAVADARGN